MNDAFGSASPVESDSAPGVSVLKGLLWREWVAHRNIVTTALAIWLVCGWALQIFFDPAWYIAFGAIYAWVIGQALGGADAAEGSEEFSFSLPPLRAERYWTGLAFGGATTLLFTGVGAAAVALDLPQALWGLVVNSGFTEPFPTCEFRFLYALAVAGPLAVFAFTYAIAANASSRGGVNWSWSLALEAAGAVLGAGFLCEHLLWGELNGLVSCPALLASGAGALLLGYRAYARKEGVSRPEPLPGAGRGRTLLVGIVIILVLMILAGWLVRHVEPVPSPPTRAALHPPPAATRAVVFDPAPVEKPDSETPEDPGLRSNE